VPDRAFREFLPLAQDRLNVGGKLQQAHNLRYPRPRESLPFRDFRLCKRWVNRELSSPSLGQTQGVGFHLSTVLGGSAFCAERSQRIGRKGQRRANERLGAPPRKGDGNGYRQVPKSSGFTPASGANSVQIRTSHSESGMLGNEQLTTVRSEKTPGKFEPCETANLEVLSPEHSGELPCGSPDCQRSWFYLARVRRKISI
jgi:hypothetical protein